MCPTDPSKNRVRLRTLDFPQGGGGQSFKSPPPSPFLLPNDAKRRPPPSPQNDNLAPTTRPARETWESFLKGKGKKGGDDRSVL